MTYLFEITEVTEDTACGLLYKKSNLEQPVEWIEISKDKLNYQLIEPGMLFWWHVTGKKSSFKPHEMMSHVWTKEEIDEIRQKAKNGLII